MASETKPFYVEVQLTMTYVEFIDVSAIEIHTSAPTSDGLLALSTSDSFKRTKRFLSRKCKQTNVQQNQQNV